MTSSIRTFWQRLVGTVHPDDESVFAVHPGHSFNLDFPPPAFIGDIDEAPVIVLMSNGGFRAGVTEAEFPDAAAVSEYREWLRGYIKQMPSRLSVYYTRQAFGNWIAAGKAVLVNAVAYRSPNLSQEPTNQAVARELPSLAAHRLWLLQEALPQAAAGKGFILLHRNRWWAVPIDWAGPCVLFSDPARAEPNRRAPDSTKLEQARRWLERIRT